MKTIAIIPARGGSKRLPKKNLLFLGTLPLIAHSILYAKENSAFIDEVYVSTDCSEIKKIAQEFGAKVIDRPSSLSGDFEPTVTALRHTLENINEVENVILLQPTNPLRPKDLLSETVSVFNEKDCDSLFTVTQNRKKFGKIEGEKFTPYNYQIGQRSQDLESLYFENGLLYISKAKLILNNFIISENAFPYLVEHPFSEVDIDTQEDLEYANFLFNKQ